MEIAANEFTNRKLIAHVTSSHEPVKVNYAGGFWELYESDGESVRIRWQDEQQTEPEVMSLAQFAQEFGQPESELDVDLQTICNWYA